MKTPPTLPLVREPGLRGRARRDVPEAGVRRGDVVRVQETSCADWVFAGRASEYVRVSRDAFASLHSSDPVQRLNRLPALTHKLGEAPLFSPRGPRPEDMRSGLMGDCGLMAVATFCARRYPHWLQRVVTPSEVGATVGYHDQDGVAKCVSLSLRYLAARHWPLRFAAGSAQCAWPMVIEKACALTLGGAYEDIDALTPRRAMAWLWGCEQTFSPCTSDSLAEWRRLLAQGECVVLHVRTPRLHAFELVAVEGTTCVAVAASRSTQRLKTRRFAWRDLGTIVPHFSASRGLAEKLGG